MSVEIQVSKTVKMSVFAYKEFNFYARAKLQEQISRLVDFAVIFLILYFGLYRGSCTNILL
jgi:hypothetical protein